jgi:LPS-assembly lipoprotein
MSSPESLLARRAFVLALFLALAGCGFRPLYGRASKDAQGYSLEARMAAIEIRPIADRLGQQVHNHLRDSLNPGGQPDNPAYYLDVRVLETTPGGLSRRDLGASRVNIRLLATFWLRDPNDEVLFTDTATAVTGFDVFRDPLNDISAFEDAESRTAELLARMIASRIGAYFSVAKAP